MTVASETPLNRLRELLAATKLPLALAETAHAAAAQRSAVQQIDDYIAPRLENLEAPLLAVVGGSTGAGKSTIVNALIGEPVTRTGAIRPTTRQPILLHAPADRDWFASTRILPGLSRVTATPTRDPVAADRAGVAPSADKISSVVLVADQRIPPHLAIIDAPDIDSIADENRALAAQLLAAADLWCFVTSANRYADAVPWKLLDDAAARDITVAVVLNRVPAGAEAEITGDLQRMLAERGLHQAPVFTITEQPLTQLGMLPDVAVAGIRHWLAGIAADRRARQEVAQRTLAGALRQLGGTVETVARERDAQLEAAADLAAVADDEYAEAQEFVSAATSDGSLLRDEVLARWHDYVGTSDVFRSVEGWISRVRDRVSGWFRGKPSPVREVNEELIGGLHAVLVEAGDRAADSTWRRWQLTPAGRAIGSDALARTSPDFRDRAGTLVREWQQSIIELIEQQAAGKRTRARIVSFGVNAVAVALMMVMFASTAGLTGGEIAIAGGSAVVGQRLLEAIFGEDAVRRLAAEARKQLDARVAELLGSERERFANALEAVTAGPDGAQLREAATQLNAEIAQPAAIEVAPEIRSLPPAAASPAGNDSLPPLPPLPQLPPTRGEG